jgi:hypothetical protein
MEVHAGLNCNINLLVAEVPIHGSLHCAALINCAQSSVQYCYGVEFVV